MGWVTEWGEINVVQRGEKCILEVALLVRRSLSVTNNNESKKFIMSRLLYIWQIQIVSSFS